MKELLLTHEGGRSHICRATTEKTLPNNLYICSLEMLRQIFLAQVELRMLRTPEHHGDGELKSNPSECNFMTSQKLKTRWHDNFDRNKWAFSTFLPV